MMNMGEGPSAGGFHELVENGNQMDKDDAAGRKSGEVKVHLLRDLLLKKGLRV